MSIYSNTGSWVTAYRCGTAVVSTMPTTFDGSLRPVIAQPAGPDPARGSCDPDDYSSGFGLWSGTSFAAPAYAGDVAAALVRCELAEDADVKTRLEILGKARAIVEEEGER